VSSAAEFEATGFEASPYDPETQARRPDASLGELLSEMTGELSALFRQEVELAKTEARDELGHVGKAGALIGGAALAGWLGLLLLSLALAWLLDQELDTALSFAIVGVLWAIAAVILLGSARAALDRLRGLPKTRQTIKEDLEWARAQKS
jgi:uncharacterized membrane protein YqjE